jgi:VanZ family protein
MNLIKNKPLLILTLCFALIFLVLLVIPTEYLHIDTRQDKSHHMLVFLALTLMAWFSLRIPLVALVVLLLSFAGISELSQYWIPYRSSNWLDMLANAQGIAAGLALIAIIILLKKLGAKEP